MGKVIKETIHANGIDIGIYTQDFENEFISLTDIARYKSDDPTAVIQNWMRNRDVIEFLGLWERLHNPDFNPLEFEGFRKQAGANAFTMSPKKWIETTNAIGIVSKAGRYGGTYAHSDIAMSFATWISPEFQLYIMKDYRRLKADENSRLSLNWNLNREISKLNYRIHTDAIKDNLIPPELTPAQVAYTYANEADRLPVVYISKTYYGEDPVDIWKLSGRLKGVAHVLVEEGTWLNERIRRQCDNKNEFNGAIGVYFPNSAYGHKKYLYRAYDGIDAVLSEKVIRSVIQYCNAQMMDKLYTWQGVNNALLRDRLSMRGAELLAAESEKNRVAAEADELIESVDEDIQKLKKQVEELTHANEILTYENQGLRSKMSSADNMPILYLGEEEEFYQGEIREMILDAIAEKLKNLGEKTRRWDALTDVLNANDYQNIRDERERTVKILFKDYKTLSASMRQQLLELGFEITEEGKHYRLTYYGDGRYKTTIAKTGSDWREGKNIASVILKSMM